MIEPHILLARCLKFHCVILFVETSRYVTHTFVDHSFVDTFSSLERLKSHVKQIVELVSWLVESYSDHLLSVMIIGVSDDRMNLYKHK
jgi:hypothetical protein